MTSGPPDSKSDDVLDVLIIWDPTSLSSPPGAAIRSAPLMPVLKSDRSVVVLNAIPGAIGWFPSIGICP
eukprot:CAMPEP_0197740206 /NCGR_PEP_ID=MMETSP1435-20131217/23012_1 /TAXON_ID=426625 /ORGANISM="Chaetoceros brevis, Strain CCMP164" /LENGTH=68 /DNA_ID=CAMNT_0043329803 /DNA_START=383 /DNA_END=589 /DNA_ORIENTATION=-